MPHPLKLVEALEDTERLAQAMYEARCGSFQFDTWESLSKSTREGYRLEARVVVQKMGGKPKMATPTGHEASRIQLGFETGFATGVAYASPSGDRTPAWEEQVRDEARKRAVNYIQQVHRA